MAEKMPSGDGDDFTQHHGGDGQHQSIFQRRQDNIEHRLTILPRVAGIELEQLPKPLAILNIDGIVKAVEFAQPVKILRPQIGYAFEHPVKRIPRHQV